ncbi:MAG: right-handed parallel beta-helix repeat-containing protein [Candidatus Micrarchaeota archaeon]
MQQPRKEDRMQRKGPIKALMPYKPDYTSWMIAALVIIAIIFIGFYLFQFPQKTDNPPIPTIAATSTPTLAPSPTPTRAVSIEPSEEPVPTLIRKEYSKCGEISSSMVLQNDIVSDGTCFTVKSEDVTIDCNGFRLSGKGKENSSAVISQYPGTVVKNCYISDFELGVRFDSADSSSVEASEFANNAGGVLAQLSKGIKITGSQFYNNTEGGIILYSVSDSEISDNFADNSKKYGIQLVGSVGNIIQGNQLYRNNYGLQVSNSNNNIIKANNVSYNSAGIKVTSRSRGNTIEGNYVYSNKGVGLHVLDSFETVIFGNTVIGNEYGINVLGTVNVIEGNFVCGNSIIDFYCETPQNSTGNTCTQRTTVCGFNCARMCP